MFARSVVRAASKASAPTFTKVSRAAFSVGAKRMYEPIAEKEIPRTTYAPGSEVQRTTIPVDPNAAPAAPTPSSPEKVVPLTKATFDKMSPMMQKMTLMNKVVIVTG